MVNNDLKKLEKLEKAFNIIKCNYIHYNIIKNYDYNSYIRHCKYFGIENSKVMTIDEFEFLQEVLEDE